jgi:hypothetical protein
VHDHRQLLKHGRRQTSSRLPRRLSRRAQLALAALALIAAAAASATATAAAPPEHFVGLQSWNLPPATKLARLDRANVHTWRANVLWSSVEARRGQYDWRRYDALFARAAANGVRLFPVLLGSPSWANRSPHYPPTESGTRGAFYRFSKAATRRYGPHGAFWRGRPWPAAARPVYWQVWNEPNLPNYWNRRVDPPDYGRFLKYTSMAAKDGDPAVRIVSAGLPHSDRSDRTYPSDDFLRGMFSVRGVGDAVDAVAVHPYAADWHGVFDRIRLARDATRSALGKTKPVFVTEFGWGTGGRHPAFSTTYSGQAARLRETYAKLLEYRRSFRLFGAFWFSFQDRESGASWQYHAGLFDREWHMKPAWRELVRITGGRP